MAKAKPKRKAKLTVDDNPKVTPQYRESGGPIDTIWCIVIRDHKGNMEAGNFIRMLAFNNGELLGH